MSGMQLYFLQILLLASSCQGNTPASYDDNGKSAISTQSPVPANIDTAVMHKLEQSLVKADQTSLIAGIDSLIAIMEATTDLFQKGNIAQYLTNLTTGDVAIENKTGQMDSAEISRRTLAALNDQQGLCKRLQQLLIVTDGRLLGVSGSETATIALLTHCRSLFLAYASIGANRPINWEDCRKQPGNQELQSYFSQYCQ